MTEKAIIVRIDTKSKEWEWLNNQKNKTMSIKTLIDLAQKEFGNKDLIQTILSNTPITLSVNNSKKHSKSDSNFGKIDKQDRNNLKEDQNSNTKGIKHSKENTSNNTNNSSNKEPLSFKELTKLSSDRNTDHE